MLGFKEKYNELKNSTYFKNLKAGVRFAIYYLGATLALGILGLITESPVLIFPLAMLISNPLVWIAMGIVIAVAHKKIAKPLFYSAKDFINKKRGLKEGVVEQKSQDPEKKSELTRSVSESSIFTQKEDTISTQDITLRRKVSLDSSGYASSEDGTSNRGTPIKRERGRRSSGDSDYSSGSDVSINSTAGKQLLVKPCPTVGDGNCFFHAVFGNNSSGSYKAEKAQQMREEWHKFLSQFTSLGDQRMPAPLREQMQKVFNMFLSKPGDLTGKSDKIKEMAGFTNKRIEKVNKKVKKLKKKLLSMGLSENEVDSNLKELAVSNFFSARRYDKGYNSENAANSFLNGKLIYEAYLEAIQNPNYYVFIEEIPILASLANVKIDVHYKNNNNNIHTPFEPNPEMVSGYQSNFLWGKKEPKTIHLEGAHYERVEVEPSITEKASSSMYDVAASVYNGIASVCNGIANSWFK